MVETWKAGPPVGGRVDDVRSGIDRDRNADLGGDDRDAVARDREIARRPGRGCDGDLAERVREGGRAVARLRLPVGAVRRLVGGRRLEIRRPRARGAAALLVAEREVVLGARSGIERLAPFELRAPRRVVAGGDERTRLLEERLRGSRVVPRLRVACEGDHRDDDERQGRAKAHRYLRSVGASGSGTAGEVVAVGAEVGGGGEASGALGARRPPLPTGRASRSRWQPTLAPKARGAAA